MSITTNVFVKMYGNYLFGYSSYLELQKSEYLSFTDTLDSHGYMYLSVTSVQMSVMGKSPYFC